MKDILMRLTPLDIFVLSTGLVSAIIVVLASRRALAKKEK